MGAPPIYKTDSYDELAQLAVIDDPACPTVRHVISHVEHRELRQRFVFIARQLLIQGEWSTVSGIRLRERQVGSIAKALTEQAAWCEKAE